MSEVTKIAIAILISFLIVFQTGCASMQSQGRTTQSGQSSSTQTNNTHWVWWLLGVVALGAVLSAMSGGDSACENQPDYPYEREDGTRVVGGLGQCISFQP